MQQHLLYFWLSLAKITPLRRTKLLEIYSIEELFDRVKLDEKIEMLVSKAAYQSLNNYADIDTLNKALDKLYTKDVKFLAFSDDLFPEKLKQANVLPPVGLFYRGDILLLKSDNPAVAIVGTRRCSEYGKDCTTKFSSELVDYGFTIVSGLATGIDAYAHTACLNSNGKTIAVLGMGHDAFYPSDNLKLYQKICNEGLVISEYLPSMPCAKYTFPERNRIVAALSDATVIIEASVKSGALITADRALEQGKEIFAVPGNITSGKSMGTNELIKKGANMLTATQDILKFFSDKNVKNPQNIPQIQLDFFEQSLYNHLKDGEKSFDELMEIDEITHGELHMGLISLEMKGVIKRSSNNKYRIL